MKNIPVFECKLDISYFPSFGPIYLFIQVYCPYATIWSFGPIVDSYLRLDPSRFISLPVLQFG
jgi:hypothetical protein